MVDSTFYLGRSVPTAREVLEVIRPQLRIGAVVGPMLISVFSFHDDNVDGGDRACIDHLLLSLRDDAVRNVKEWATDVDKVFDGVKLLGFIIEALSEVVRGAPSDAVLDVLALDEGVCETIGFVFRRLSVPVGDDDGDPDGELAGIAATYFGRV